MSYLNNFLGVGCWKCKHGKIKLLDKSDGVYLTCSSYPTSCQFISASPIQCPNCGQGSLLSRFEENILYFVHDNCGFKSETSIWNLKELPHQQLNEFRLKNWGMREIPPKYRDYFEPIKTLDYDYSDSKEASYLKDTGLLIDYLTTLSFEELNGLWDAEAWANSENLPIPDSLDESTVKEIIQKIRSVKWKLLNKK